jgi:hypothetical protein
VAGPNLGGRACYGVPRLAQARLFGSGGIPSTLRCRGSRAIHSWVFGTSPRSGAMEVTGDHVGFSVTLPASVSALSLPGVPACPLVQEIPAVCCRIGGRSSVEFSKPGPAPDCPARAIALVESQWMVMCRYREVTRTCS